MASITRQQLQERIDHELDTWAKQYPDIPAAEVAGRVTAHVIAYCLSVDAENQR